MCPKYDRSENVFVDTVCVHKQGDIVMCELDVTLECLYSMLIDSDLNNFNDIPSFKCNILQNSRAAVGSGLLLGGGRS